MSSNAEVGPESECPKCGEPCNHSNDEKYGFALDALKEAEEWYDGLKHTNKVYEYIPAIVDGDPIHKAFTTQEELLGMGWIDRWTKRTGFVRFVLLRINSSVTKHNANYALGAEFDKATTEHQRRHSPWLIAFLDNNEGLELEVLKCWQEQGPQFS